jgi:hypothetical protein
MPPRTECPVTSQRSWRSRPVTAPGAPRRQGRLRQRRAGQALARERCVVSRHHATLDRHGNRIRGPHPRTEEAPAQVRVMGSPNEAIETDAKRTRGSSPWRSAS